jgi:hypothetical protein
MIPAKITNLNPVQVTFNIPMSRTSGTKKWLEEIEVIADVENVEEYFTQAGLIVCYMFNNVRLELNQSYFIEESGEGKCKIVKI